MFTTVEFMCENEAFIETLECPTVSELDAIEQAEAQFKRHYGTSLQAQAIILAY